MTMKNNRLSAREWGERIVLALFFAAVGSLIMLVFSPWRPMLDKVTDYFGRIGLIVLLLAAVLLARRSKRLEKYGQILFGFLIMAVAVSLVWVFAIYLGYLGEDGNSVAGSAIQKLTECAVIVIVVILFTRMSGGSLGSLYIQKGNLKLGLIIGLTCFFLAAAGAIPMANLLFNPLGDLTLERIIPWIPWILIFILGNALAEELLFRGLFLRKLEPFFGKFMSNFMVAFVFTLLHGTVKYTSNEYIFLAVLFPLALVWGYIMQKTDSIWGSILFHAGMDIPIMLGIFSNFT
jgi:membrane protease YdiL (CAAX protease family)